jgi:hypothetical protein
MIRRLKETKSFKNIEAGKKTWWGAAESPSCSCPSSALTSNDETEASTQPQEVSENVEIALELTAR